MSRRRQPPRTNWSENPPQDAPAPAPEPGPRRGLPQEWYTRILLLCVLCSVISAVGVIINGSLGSTVVTTEQRSKANAAKLDRAVTAAPKAQIAATKVARTEAAKAAKATRRVVLREARTVFARQIIREIGKRGATGRPPTLEEIRAAVADCVTAGLCVQPISVDVALLALKRCVDVGGCGALRGPQGDKGEKGDAGADAPPVSDERLDEHIDERWALYCAMHGGCAGQKGDKGDKGDPGPLSIPPCASLDPALGYACTPPPLFAQQPPPQPPPPPLPPPADVAPPP